MVFPFRTKMGWHSSHLCHCRHLDIWYRHLEQWHTFMLFMMVHACSRVVAELGDFQKGFPAFEPDHVGTTMLVARESRVWRKTLLNAQKSQTIRYHGLRKADSSVVVRMCRRMHKGWIRSDSNIYRKLPSNFHLHPKELEFSMTFHQPIPMSEMFHVVWSVRNGSRSCRSAFNPWPWSPSW